MIGVVGASWSWRQRLVNIGWFAQRPVAADKRDLLIETLKKDLQFTGMAPDTYSFGKGVLISSILGMFWSHRSFLKNFLVLRHVPQPSRAGVQKSVEIGRARARPKKICRI